MSRLRSSLLAFAVLAAGAFAPSTAQAGGYDTPILYSARHMGAGGAAVGWVNDPSALFHNPAGLGRIEGLSLMADFSLLLGTVTAAPFPSSLIESNTTVAPFFLLGAAYELTDWMVLGFAVYPVASAGAEFEDTDLRGEPRSSSTTLLFIEASPGVSFRLPANITLGAGYRLTYASLEKVADGSGIDFTVTGINAASFRVGAQWEVLPTIQANKGWNAQRMGLSLGVAYRHRIDVDLTADEGQALNFTFEDLEATFTLPSRLTSGLRADIWRLGVLFDFEYGFNSQNKKTVLSGVKVNDDGTRDSMRTGIPNIFRWTDAVTLRTGLEYRPLDELPIATRIGYIFDGKTANEKYPTAFGTPPGATHSLTIGGGYDAGPWQANVAYAYRFGSGNASSNPPGDCQLCNNPNSLTLGDVDYEMSLHGIYLDFSYNFK